jgi:3-deoxy-D-manno-octulosonate 8-phosphate phosphatase (KDO 8-P phosphatase)
VLFQYDLFFLEKKFYLATMQYTNEELEAIFTQLGAQFTTSIHQLEEKLAGIKAFVFDWDGVFNNGVKNENKSSHFNEVDSMGTNMLRFSHYLSFGELPATAIISGEKNEMAFYFSEREHFDACYFKVADKTIALHHFCQEKGLKPSEVCYVFDDVLDISLAAICGIRILIRRKANPLFTHYMIQNKYVDYITAEQSGGFAVREASEVLMGLRRNFTQCLNERKDFTDTYRNYLNKRQAIAVPFYTVLDGEIILAQQ